MSPPAHRLYLKTVVFAVEQRYPTLMRTCGVRCDDLVCVRPTCVDVIRHLRLRQNTEVDVHLGHGAEGRDQALTSPVPDIPRAEAKAPSLFVIRVEK